LGDDFSPNGRLFTLGSFFENDRSGPHSCDTFFLSIDYVLILVKMCSATFWAIFSYTHPVTLAENKNQQSKKPFRVLRKTKRKKIALLKGHTADWPRVARCFFFKPQFWYILASL
jgi:hypothetical protein